MLEKYDEVVFYAINREKFKDYLSLKSEFESGNYRNAQEPLSQMIDELTEFSNIQTPAQKEFYDYYGEFTSVKNLKKSQTPKIKLRLNQLIVTQRQLKTGSSINTQEFLDFYLHWHCAEYFSAHWFLLTNKYLSFSINFIETLIKEISFFQKVLEDLELPPVFLPLDKGITADPDADSDDFHEILPPQAGELLAAFNAIPEIDSFGIQTKYFKECLDKTSQEIIYLLLKFND